MRVRKTGKSYRAASLVGNRNTKIRDARSSQAERLLVFLDCIVQADMSSYPEPRKEDPGGADE